MRDPQRIDRLLELLRALWKQHPDLRLCQLVTNLGTRTASLGSITDSDLFYVEDDLIEEEMKDVLSKGW